MFQVSSCDQVASDANSDEAINRDLLSACFHTDPNILVDEMNGLTVLEREKVYEEVHGVANVVEETPDFVSTKLQAIQDELAKIPKQRRKALDRAFFLHPKLKDERKSYLMFLRATRFDPSAAAALMCRHYDHKLKLFGETRLCRSITIDDLNETEQALFSTAPCMLLTSNDQVGRGIYLMTFSQFDFQDSMAMLRFAWYQIMSVLEGNEEMQRRGVVQIVAFYGKRHISTNEILDFLWHISDVARDWPFRTCGFHFCYDSTAFRSAIEFIQVAMGKELRLRQRCHFGTQLDARRSLLTYGINLKDCFSPGEGLLSEERLRLQLEYQYNKEAESRRKGEMEIPLSVSNLIDYPGKFDVLMGRGKPFLGWEGNLRLSELIREHADQYQENKITRVDKTMIAMKIVQVIQINGGRFIKRIGNGWKIVGDQTAKEKVSQGLRAEVRWRSNGLVDEPIPPLSYSLNIDDCTPEVKRHRIRE